MKLFPSLKNRLKKFEVENKIIDRDTRIVSMGSCFATHISRYLIDNKFNYLLCEPIRSKIVTSARWDFTYNTASMRQIFEYSFDPDWEVKERWWDHSNTQVQDPYRRGVVYSRKDAKELFERHRKKSRQALEEAEVIILTIGLAETWRSKKDGATFFQVPPKRILDLNKHTFYIQSAEDVKEDLVQIYRLLRSYNSKVKLVVTVSPVPLMGTFREDVDVVTANSASKSILRAGVDGFFRESDAYYFPSYEIAQEIPDRWREDDGRHLKWEVIDSIMEVFIRNWTSA